MSQTLDFVIMPLLAVMSFIFIYTTDQQRIVMYYVPMLSPNKYVREKSVFFLFCDVIYVISGGGLIQESVAVMDAA